MFFVGWFVDIQISCVLYIIRFFKSRKQESQTLHDTVRVSCTSVEIPINQSFTDLLGERQQIRIHSTVLAPNTK